MMPAQRWAERVSFICGNRSRAAFSVSSSSGSSGAGCSMRTASNGLIWSGCHFRWPSASKNGLPKRSVMMRQLRFRIGVKAPKCLNAAGMMSKVAAPLRATV